MGSQIILEQSLTVPARRWSVYFQRGEAMNFGQVDPDLGYCELKVHGPKSQPQTIAPDRFEVTAADRRIDRTASRTVRLAANRATRLALVDRVYWEYTQHMQLASTSQPFIRAFDCTARQEARLGRFMSLADARAAVGATLRLRPASAIGVDE